MELTVTELVLLMVQIGSAWKAVTWWIERRDARSALATAKQDADKTVTTLTATVATQRAEIDELKADHQFDQQMWQDERRMYLDRIAHLESLKYGPGVS